jgi:hypothetical protein
MGLSYRQRVIRFGFQYEYFSFSWKIQTFADTTKMFTLNSVIIFYFMPSGFTAKEKYFFSFFAC